MFLRSTSPQSLGAPLPRGSWKSHGGGSTAGMRFGSHRVRFRASVERLTARLSIDPSGAATLTASVPERRLFELRFDTGQVTISGDSVELDGLLTIDRDPIRVVARGSIRGASSDRRRLTLETVFDRRQLGLGWEDLDDEVTLYADLEFEREP